mgnify:CR=1 FL=1
MNYSEKLQDVRWQKRRLGLLNSADWKCENCGSDDNRGLDVHHSYYEKNREPWEYPDDSLRVLCRDCHERMASVERCVLRSLNQWNDKEIILLVEAIMHAGDDSMGLAVSLNGLVKNQEAMRALFLEANGNTHVRFSMHYVAPEEELSHV